MSSGKYLSKRIYHFDVLQTPAELRSIFKVHSTSEGNKRKMSSQTTLIGYFADAFPEAESHSTFLFDPKNFRCCLSTNFHRESFLSRASNQGCGRFPFSTLTKQIPENVSFLASSFTALEQFFLDFLGTFTFCGQFISHKQFFT
jgi:hypothetical protein